MIRRLFVRLVLLVIFLLIPFAVPFTRAVMGFNRLSLRADYADTYSRWWKTFRAGGL